MKKVVISTVFLLMMSYTYAQTNDTLRKRNTLYFELFGQGLINSFNYDRLLVVKPKYATSLTVGFSSWGHLINTSVLKVNSSGIPISYNFLKRKNKHNLEIGLGLTISKFYMEDQFHDFFPLLKDGSTPITTQNFWKLQVVPKIGYRLQKPGGGSFFKVSFTPIFPFWKKGEVTTDSGGDVTTVKVEKFTLFQEKGLAWIGIAFGVTF